ncbi:Glu/Leu/Phe/Val family dehydrogenase, partial [Maribacter sp.]|uniref:Glu/Leu/Phe/Val family dehydrogenase n=1 Tax=Maribacter sp. TaxID=1897614 RepID=UPI0025BE5585
PIGAGGSKGRDRATGYGVFLTIKFWAESNNIKLRDKKFIVQGFGNVGYWAAFFLVNEGAILTAVQDAYGSIANEDGIDVDQLLEYSQGNKGSILGYAKARTIDSKDFFSLDCDICIPAALGNQITAKNAHKVKAYLIAEGANGPTDVDAEEILLQKGIDIIPDILCNSGGVIGSYFEWLQNRNGEIWSLDEVMEKLEKKMKESFSTVLKTSKERKVDMRTAAFVIAIERLEEAYVQRGIFP